MSIKKKVVKNNLRKKLGVESETSCDFAIKKVNEEESGLFITGYAATGDKDRVRDVITDEAMKDSEKDLLRPGSKTVLYNHDDNMPIGVVVDSSFDGKGIKVKIKISGADDVSDIRKKITEGTLNSLSIRLRYHEIEYVEDDKGYIDEYRILKMELFEVSVVSVPCNASATILEVTEKSFGGFVGKSKLNKKGKKMAIDKKDMEEIQEYIGEKLAGSSKTLTEKIDSVSEKYDSVVESINTLTESVKALSTLKTEGEADSEGEGEGEGEGSDDIKALREEIKSLNSKLEQSTGKKSEAGGDGDEGDGEGEGEEDGTPKKCISFDPKKRDEAVKYVQYLMNDAVGNEEYKKLSEAERKNVKKLLFVVAQES